MENNVCTEKAIRQCTGCSMCSAFCPDGAISIKETDDGFFAPQVDKSKCTSCGLCLKICYKFDKDFCINKNENYKCFSAINKDEGQLKSASSGGLSAELMRQCLKEGYFVAGVAYDTQSARAVTKIAKCPEELEAFKGSKYFQSYTETAFAEILADKSDQKYAVFGTPCQIYAFNKLSRLNGNRDKFLLVDIFCHGTPSLKLWDKYLDFAQKSAGVDRFDEIKFRSKAHGWHEFTFDFIKDGKTTHNKKINDPFYEIFFSINAMNEACYDCVARSNAENADIRMGDFWGKQFDQNKKGVSAAVIITEKGEKLFNAVKDKFYIQSFSFDEVVFAQSYGKKHILNKQKRDNTLCLLKGNLNIKEIQKKCRKDAPLSARIKRVVKNLIKLLPQTIYFKIKAILH